MAQSRIALLNSRSLSIGSSTYTVPAGITRISVSIGTAIGTPYFAVFNVDVVPNTTYTITINATTFAYGSQNSFGSLFTFAGGTYLNIMGVE